MPEKTFVQASQTLLEACTSKTMLAALQDPEVTVPVSSGSNSAVTALREHNSLPTLARRTGESECSENRASASRESTAIELLNLHTALTSLKGLTNLQILGFGLFLDQSESCLSLSNVWKR